MSTSYDLRCKTCGSDLGLLSNSASGVSQLRVEELYRLRWRLEALSFELEPFMHHEDASELEWQFTICSTRFDLGWFGEHGSHEVVIVNEYGDEVEPRRPV